MAITRTDTKRSIIYACDLCGWQRGSRRGEAHWEVCPICYFRDVNIMNDVVIEQAKRPQKKFEVEP